jgi:phytoene desaturase
MRARKRSVAQAEGAVYHPPMSQNAVVIGGGFGGLSAAAFLAKDGWSVTVVEKNQELGGRARVWREGGFLFDLGPSWYLMPEVFERFFAHFGKKVSDYYDLRALSPYYRLFFGADGNVDITGDKARTDRTFAGFEADGDKKLARYLEQSRYKYDIAMKSFLYRDYTSLFQFLNARMLTEGVKLNVFSSLDRFVERYFHDRRAKQILEYAMVFLGNSPRNAPALYSIMSHVDLNLGVHYPMAGLGAVVEGMASLCRSLGVRIVTGAPVQSISVEGGRATHVDAGGAEMDADIVVSSCDYAHTETALLGAPWRTYPESYWKKRVLAPSMFLIYLGLSRRLRSLVHHNLYFQTDWDRHFQTIFGKRAWPDDPCFYLSCPSVTDPSVAPAGSENLFVLVPVAPGLDDPDQHRERYAEQVLDHVERVIGEKIRDSIVVRRIFSHRDFSADYNALQGTALGMAHTLNQTAVFRPGHHSRKVRNLYFTGQYTHPGVGVPMTLIASEILRDVVARS